MAMWLRAKFGKMHSAPFNRKSFRANGALKLLTGHWKQNFNCFGTGGFKSKDRKKIKMIFHLLPPGQIIQFVTVTLGGEQK